MHRLALLSCAVWSGNGAVPKDVQQLWWPQDAGGPVVEIEYGLIEGSTRHPLNPLKEFVSVDGFFGIPYADPPLYKNRFRAPQPFANPWGNATRQAKKLAPTCPQLDIAAKVHFGDENCLHLNVYRPSGTPEGADLPVLFWIYGGGFFLGDSYHFVGKDQDGLYDGFNVVQRQQHVVVSHNYRLNGFGFMALPELEKEDPNGSIGNWGMMDQRAALQWTQRNIRAFGGNPNHVTIVGESAGGISVAWHLVSPQSKGLFHAAIIQSGCTQNQWFFHKKEFAVQFYEEWSNILGCSGPGRLQCLRELPPEKMMVPVLQWVTDWAARFAGLPIPADVPAMASPIFPAAPFAPVIDGTGFGLLDMPITLLEKGEFNKVPLIVGGNVDDGAYLGPTLPLLWGAFPFSGYDLNKLVSWMLPDERDQQKALLLYGTEGGFPQSDSWHKNAYKRFFRDAMFSCATRDFSTTFSRHGVPVYTYSFAFDYHAGFPLSTLGAPHAFELVFTWRNGVNFFGHLRFDEEKYQKMAGIMSCMWSSFVTCHQPKCYPSVPNCEEALKNVVDWPQFNANSTSRRYLSIKDNSEVKIVPATAKYGDDEFPGDDRCDFWRNANMDWQGIRHGISSPNFENCAADGDCLKSTTGEFGCCSGLKHIAGSCASQTKCGCIQDDQCMDVRNDASECCSGKKHFTMTCPSQKKCGCLEDGSCLNVEADETDCCSGLKTLASPLKCPSLKQCGGNSTTLV